MTRSLAVVPDLPRPTVKVPAGPWRPWFLNEVEPLGHSAIEVSPEFRRRWTKESPLRFALVYLDHHLVLQGSRPPAVTFNEVHLAMTRAAKRWQQPKRWREAWIAPRGIGKSSWAFLILPLWAIAHGHREYFMAFSATKDMANGQLATLRMELETNKLLRQDYPELAPRRVKGASNTKATVVANGGTIAAAGLGENTLGRKSGAARPDLLILDDIEKMDEVMSEVEKRKLVTTITSAVIPMAADHAAIGIFGTTTSYESVVDDLARHARGEKTCEWAQNNGFTARVFPGVRIDPNTGEERSIWPERWRLTDTHLGEHLRKTPDDKTPREFELNFLLNPSPFGTGVGSFWRPELFQYRDSHSFGGVWEHAMYIDPSMSDKPGADGTAIVIVGRDPAQRRAVIEYAQSFRVSVETLRQRIHRLIERKPTLRTVIVERNQGGERWREMLSPRHDPLPGHVKLMTDWSSDSKRDRCEQALQWYETSRVFHAIEHTEMEREMVMFPTTGVNDDLVDAATGALRWALDGK